MSQITIDVNQQVADKFNNLVKLFGNKDLLFENFIEYHINKLKREIAGMQEDIDKYEKQYKMESSVFFEQFEKGELGDGKDFMIWSGIYEMQCKQNLQKLL
jgi:hypothetical protein